MQLLRLLPLAIISFSLSACIFEKDTNKSKTPVLEDQTSIQPVKGLEKEEDKILATNSDYIPQDGDQSIDFVTMKIYRNSKLLVNDSFSSIKNYSYITELPNQFGYQHIEAGPYIKAENLKQYNDRKVEKTAVRYITQTPPYTLLINHDLNDHVYSVAEFNQESSTSSHESDGFMTQGEILTETQQEQLFDESTGNTVGLSYSTIKVTALDLETINIRSGTFSTAKASFQSEATNTIDADSSKSWTQSTGGFMWFDINTGRVLKITSVGTFIRADYPNQVLNTRYGSELASSDEYPKATITISASKNNTDASLKSIAMKGVIKNNPILTNKFSTKLTTGFDLGKLPL